MWERSKLVIFSMALLIVVTATIFSSKFFNGGKSDTASVRQGGVPANSTTVARIGGEELTLAQLVGQDAVTLYRLQRAEYEFKMDRLRQLSRDRILAQAAQKVGMTVDEFERQKIVGGDVKISDAELREFEKEKRIDSSQVSEEMREKIRSLLSQRKREQMVNAFVLKHLANEKIESFLPSPKLVVQLGRGDGPALGAENAQRTVVLFSDLACEACASALETLHRAVEKYGRHVRFEFRYRAIDTQPGRRAIAEAAFCSFQQGAAKFWKFARVANKAQHESSPLKIAEQAGVNIANLQECLAKKGSVEHLQKDMLAAERLGLRSSPAFIVDDHYLPGDATVADFDEFLAHSK